MPILEIRSTDADQSLSYVITGTGEPSKYNDPEDDTLKAGRNDNIHTFSDGTYVIIGHTNNQYGDAYDVEQQPDAFRQYDGDSGYSVNYDGVDITGELETVSDNDWTPKFIDPLELRKWYLTRYPELAEGAVFPDAGSTEDGAPGDGGDPGDGEEEPTEPQGMYLSNSLTIRSNMRTPAMEYTIHIQGTVQGGSSLESRDTINPGNPTVINGTVGPSGADTYNITGYVTRWEFVDADTGNIVDRSRYDILYDGDPIGVWEILGEPKPEYSDDSAAALGGGQYYSQQVTESQADYVVESLSEARDVLHNRATSGDIVFVPEGTEIYSPRKSQRMHVPSGVTFASNRGSEGSDGALLHTDAQYSYGADGLVTAESDARVTGFRVRGPHPDVRWQPHTYDYEMSGIEAVGPNVEVDNNEVYGWAVCVNQSGEGMYVHHNHLHHANMEGLGYGIHASSHEGGIFEYNHFEHWRHAVAASGGGGFEVRHNIIGGPCISHAIDQHSPGGTYTRVFQNTSTVMEHDQSSKDPVFVALRGGSVRNAEIKRNWVQGNTKMPRSNPSGWTDEFLIRVYDNGTGWNNVEWNNNHLGTTEPPDSNIGAPR